MTMKELMEDLEYAAILLFGFPEDWTNEEGEEDDNE